METGKEIISSANNIRYYAKRISELAERQFGKDCEVAQVTGIQSEPGSKRFDAIGAISAGTKWLESYCGYIESNVRFAEEFDKKLKPEVELKEMEESKISEVFR